MFAVGKEDKPRMMNNAVFPVAPPLRLPISHVHEDGRPIQESPLLVRAEVGKSDGVAGRTAAHAHTGLAHPPDQHHHLCLHAVYQLHLCSVHSRL